MSRTTPRKPRPVARASDVEMMIAARRAVAEAMRKLHDRNPALYHMERPTLAVCIHDPDCPFTEGATR